ncbi:hypothetical protein RI367_005173 [Sorochytrium milnesiophthora]
MDLLLNSDLDQPRRQADVDYFISVCAMLMALPALSLNIFVIHLLRRQLRDMHAGRVSAILTMYKLSANTMMMLASTPTMVYSAFTHLYTPGFVACQVQGYFISVAGFWSAVSTPLLGLERYAAVVLERKFSIRTWTIAIIASFIGSFALATLPFWLKVPFVMQPSLQYCMNRYYDPNAINLLICVIGVSAHCLNLVSMLYMYTHIYLKVRQVQKEVRKVVGDVRRTAATDAGESIIQSAVTDAPSMQVTNTASAPERRASDAPMRRPSSATENTVSKAKKKQDLERVVFIKACAISLTELGSWAPYLLTVGLTLAGYPFPVRYVADLIAASLVVTRCQLDCGIVVLLDPLPRQTLLQLLATIQQKWSQIKSAVSR